MALWLATHDDLANPASADPIARLSTRITCAATTRQPGFLAFFPTLEINPKNPLTL